MKLPWVEDDMIVYTDILPPPPKKTQNQNQTQNLLKLINNYKKIQNKR